MKYPDHKRLNAIYTAECIFIGLKPIVDYTEFINYLDAFCLCFTNTSYTATKVEPLRARSHNKSSSSASLERPYKMDFVLTIESNNLLNLNSVQQALYCSFQLNSKLVGDFHIQLFPFVDRLLVK
jgi:hypothetical protein